MESTQHYVPGAVVLGRYVIDSLMGEGGMGQVYSAHHTELSRKRFAIKTLRPELFGVGGLDERFRREADVLASLNHPGIVSIVDYGIDGGRTPVMVMEMLEGETLRARLGREGRLPIAEVLRVTREVASALDYTHARNPPVVHRDLKPENLFLVEPDARLKVLDFGIAKVTGLKSSLTQTSIALGTPQYMSPEQLRDAKTVDTTTDVFALGSIVYEMLTAQLAFPGEEIGAVVLAVFDARRPRPSLLRADVPEAVDIVLAHAWSIDPRQRFQSTGAFANALAGAFGGALPATRPGPDAPTPTPTSVVTVAGLRGRASDFEAAPTQMAQLAPRRRGRLPLFLGLGVAALAVAMGGFFAAERSPSSHATVPTPPQSAGATNPNTAVPNEPVLGGAAASAGNSPLSNVLGGGPARAPRSAFDVVHDELAGALPGCMGTVPRPARVTIEVTWNGALGLPIHSTYSPAALRTCMSDAVLRYGQIPPQDETLVTRRFVYQVP